MNYHTNTPWSDKEIARNFSSPFYICRCSYSRSRKSVVHWHSLRACNEWKLNRSCKSWLLTYRHLDISQKNPPENVDLFTSNRHLILNYPHGILLLKCENTLKFIFFYHFWTDLLAIILQICTLGFWGALQWGEYWNYI